MVVKIKGEQYFIALAHAPDETNAEEMIKMRWQDFGQSIDAFRNLSIIFLSDANAKINDGRNTYNGGCEAEK